MAAATLFAAACGSDGDNSKPVTEFESVTEHPNPVSVTVHAGIDVSVFAGETVTLRGSVDNAGEFDGLTYAWKLAQLEVGPDDALSVGDLVEVDELLKASIILDDDSVAEPSFVAPNTTREVILTFELGVSASGGGSGNDRVRVAIKAPTAPAVDDQYRPRPLPGHQGAIQAVSLSADGRLALTGSRYDHAARLWDAQTGEELHAWTNDNAGAVTAVALSEDGRIALTGRTNGTMQILDTASGELLHNMEVHRHSIEGQEDDGDADDRPWTRALHSISLARDGGTALTGSRDGALLVWDTASGKRLRVLRVDEDVAYSTALSGDGGTALAIINDRMQLWNVATGEELRTLNVEEYPTQVAMSGDGTIALTGHAFGAVHLWDTTTGEMLHDLEGHGETIFSVAMSTDGRFALTGSQDLTARLWNVQTGEFLRELGDYDHHVLAVTMSSDNSTALVGTQDGIVQLWNMETDQPLRTLNGHVGDQASSVALSGDGGMALTGGYDNTARLWDTETRELLRMLPHDGRAIHRVALSGDGSRALTASRGLDETGHHDKAILWETSTGEPLKNWRYEHRTLIDAVPLGNDGTIVLALKDDGGVRLIDASTDREIRTLNDAGSDVYSIALSGDGRIALTGGSDLTARLWDVSTGEQLHVLEGHTNPVYSVALSSDGRMALTRSANSVVLLWDVATGEPLDALLHVVSTYDVALSMNGGVVMVNDLFTAWLWDWDASTSKELHLLPHSAGRALAMAMSMDGSTVLMADEGRPWLWDVPAALR